TSQNTVSVNMKMHTPHRTINAASSQSNALHLRWRWRWRIKARMSAMRLLPYRMVRRAGRIRRRCGFIRTTSGGINPALRARAFIRTMRGRMNPTLPGRMNPALLHVADELQELHRVGPELRRELILDRRRRLDERRLVDVLDDLHAHRLQLVGRVLLELERHRRLFLAHF